MLTNFEINLCSMALNAVAKFGNFFHKLELVLTTVARVTLLRQLRKRNILRWLSKSERCI